MLKKIVVFLFLFSLAFAQDYVNNRLTQGVYSDQNFPVRLYNGPTVFSEDFFSTQLLEYSIESLFDFYYEPVVNQLLSTGDFSFADNYVFSFLGNSWLWNKYYYNDIAINDVFFSGQTYHKIPALGNSLTLNALKGTLAQKAERKKNFSYLQTTVGGLGGPIPFYKVFTDDYTKETPAFIGDPPEETKNVNVGGQVYQRLITPLKIGEKDYILLNDVFLNVQNRDFLFFDYGGFAGTFNETVANLTSINEFIFPDGTSSLGLLLTYDHRDHLFAEFYFNPENTANYDEFALTMYYKNNNLLKQNHGLTIATKDIEQNSDVSYYNIYNVTGEGIDPFYPSITTVELNQNSSFSYGFAAVEQDFFTIKGILNNSFLATLPKNNNSISATFFRTEAGDNNRSLYVGESEHEETHSFLIENQLSVQINKIKKPGFHVEGEAGLDLDGFAVVSEEGLARVSPFFNIGMNILNNNTHFLRIEIGRENIPFDSGYTTFLADGYQTTRNYLWDDNNDNFIYESSERSATLHSTSGGAYHDIKSSFKQPHYYYIDVPYTFNIDLKNNVVPFFSISTSLHYRIFKNQVWVAAVGNENYCKTIDEKPVCFSNYGEKNYTITNLPKEYFPSSNRNWFNNGPMYLGAIVKLALQGSFFYTSLSFNAFLVNGITTLGNGARHNSLGIINENLADPNQVYKNVGRLDTDRAYMGKWLVNIWPTPFMAITTTLRYQDGQPIGKWGYYLSDDPNNRNVALLRENVSGDNILLYGGEFGTREDALWIFDLKFTFLFSILTKHDFTLFLNFYNLLDIGRSLLEYSTFKPGGADREVLETQIPRGIHLGIKFEY